jgi:hypothetical protein
VGMIVTFSPSNIYNTKRAVFQNSVRSLHTGGNDDIRTLGST